LPYRGLDGQSVHLKYSDFASQATLRWLSGRGRGGVSPGGGVSQGARSTLSGGSKGHSESCHWEVEGLCSMVASDPTRLWPLVSEVAVIEDPSA